MESTEQNIFQTTFEGLENGLSVQHIAASPLKHCKPQDSIQDGDMQGEVDQRQEIDRIVEASYLQSKAEPSNRLRKFGLSLV